MDTEHQNKYTLVTGLWNLGRENLAEGWSRSYEHYLNKFEELLRVDYNLIVFGDRELEQFVKQRRSEHNTQFVLRDIEWFKNNNYYEQIQQIRLNEDWLSQAHWLRESTQAKLELYNPLVMSKIFLLNDARILDRFNSEYLYWVDAGITNTVHIGYFTDVKVIDHLNHNNFTFICFPYETTTEIHGFNYKKLCEFANDKVDKVARGGFFGGPISTIANVNTLYYNLLQTTLHQGLMGTEESLFTILLYRYPETFEYALIEGNGLIYKYFEDIKQKTAILHREKNKNLMENTKTTPYTDKAGLYVLTFNSPKQFETLLKSMKAYDENFLAKTTKFLLNNSTDSSTFDEYERLCQEHGFEHIKQDNIGICRGRQFIAEHFDKTDLEYMFFFEDDMFFYPNEGTVCKFGFNRYVKNLYDKIMHIINNEPFDFLKMCFTEYFGTNSTQWSWYNVPQSKREEYWPTYYTLPTHGYDPHCPNTVFKHIKSYEGVPYTSGEIYYSNWPQIVTKEGNKKMFLDTVWAHPYEQTWMSYMFQKTKEGVINPGLLLISPIEHDRFEHYSKDLRKEN